MADKPQKRSDAWINDALWTLLATRDFLLFGERGVNTKDSVLTRVKALLSSEAPEVENEKSHE